MKALKTYLLIATGVITVLSFIVMVFGYFIRTTATGFIASWVFGLSFCMFVHLGIPSDDFGKSSDSTTQDS